MHANRRYTRFEVNYSIAHGMIGLILRHMRRRAASAPEAQASAIAVLRSSEVMGLIYCACSRHPVSKGLPRLGSNAVLSNREVLAILEEGVLALEILEDDYPLESSR